MIKKKLEIILENEKIRLKQMESIFSKLPKGKLYTRTVRGKKYFSVYLNGKEKGITHDQELVEQFKTKETLETNIDSTANTCSLISSVIDSLSNYSCNDPISICWSKEKYDSNPYKAEHLIFKTLKGHLVRSKSERFIADTLYMLNIPYRYECFLDLGGHIIYPDFMILKPNSELLLWEHFGLLDNEEYLKSCLIKLKRYNENGYCLHRNLICTTEKDIKDKKVIEDIIQRFYFS